MEARGLREMSCPFMEIKGSMVALVGCMGGGCKKIPVRCDFLNGKRGSNEQSFRGSRQNHNGGKGLQEMSCPFMEIKGSMVALTPLGNLCLLGNAYEKVAPKVPRHAPLPLLPEFGMVSNGEEEIGWDEGKREEKWGL
ncbi:hypothetical protein FH972_010387 [Carpinus fangiana]|uniref:Uncharacterized protein n=1 Tax=Carpinus fangiana TaxID=176857 RepID=A0A660KN73_9ROSI|nr:hypothetical protein FH972_010387 [Carpinus fangiana]